MKKKIVTHVEWLGFRDIGSSQVEFEVFSFRVLGERYVDDVHTTVARFDVMARLDRARAHF